MYDRISSCPRPMMTSLNGNIIHDIGPLGGEITDHRSPVNSPHKGQWRGVSMLYLIYV